jgi:rhodanese-related sulfurtransferase
MKTALDLVMAAKAQSREIALTQVDSVLAAADVVIDVREPDEYAAGHLQGAVNLPRGLLEFKLSGNPALERRDLAVVLYCKNSGRAALSACSMQAMGYLNVVSIAGGYDAWVAAGKPVVTPNLPTFG